MHRARAHFYCLHPGGGGSPGPWILATGIWNDAGAWDDAAAWID